MSRRTTQLLLSGLLTVVGVILAAGKIIFDSEPGLIPLILIAVGVVWHVTARRRLPSGKGE
jgi:hypothetical protein